ncbi:MAG: dihydroorotate dehydrogenase-like protein [Planctomycetes bacterium]|nr:dihydroorotate dehydrogenase-like protein [Planctomycetota bacterium]
MSANLSTTWLGLKLPHPLMPGASPLVDDLETVAALEAAGAAAIVMHSLFEEQIRRETDETEMAMDAHSDTYVEARSYFPPRDMFPLGPESYLEHLKRLKSAVRIPVIASLNGSTRGGWIEFARAMQDAGADALELNVYDLGADPDESAAAAEERILRIVESMRKSVKIGFAVKLSPFYTSLANLARRISLAGADGLILFNRFYQPDIDVEALEVSPTLHLSTSSELLLRLRWLAILSPAVNVPLAVSGGVHDTLDVVKAVMSGAGAVQVVSALLQHGPERLKSLIQGFRAWLDEHDYVSVAQMKGSMSLARCPDPKAVERSNYAHLLQSWRKAQVRS